MRILETHYCGKERCEAFKLQGDLNDFLCHRGYAERVVSIFARQNELEYYGGNRSLSIEGISLEHFSALDHPNQCL